MQLNQLRNRDVYVDFIRTVAIVFVLFLHSSGRWLITSQELHQLTLSEFVGWSIVDLYQSIGVIGAPLFVMLSGALLLQPGKTEPLTSFFKKRWARIGLPFFFWSAIYFVWVFVVQKAPFSIEAVVQGLLNGPYTQFWYIYVLVGIYLWTPILRIFLNHADPKMVKYFIIIWLFGASLIPFFDLLTIFQLHRDVFTITGFVGYFVLGSYLTTVNVRRSTVVKMLFAGLALTSVGTYVMATTGGGQGMYFFQEYLSPTVILSTSMVFLLLLQIKLPSVQNQNSQSKLDKLVTIIGQNTLALYLVHVLILETFQKGYLLFAINRETLNPIVQVPLLTVIVLFASLATILLLKKVPYLNKLIG
ncbi:MAG: acyltransferase family protein [Candidatus Bathyarchaeota archaeon]|nr:acyltransferase family protein [Candidatus Bathyarchaeum tardum]